MREKLFSSKNKKYHACQIFSRSLRRSHCVISAIKLLDGTKKITIYQRSYNGNSSKKLEIIKKPKLQIK